MKILYGVQGTGNGHITRARALSRYFEEFGVSVEYLFSGRKQSDYFDMESFGNRIHFRQGFTFYHQAGAIQHFKTIKNNSVTQFWRDIQQLDLRTFDAVLTDFEPISAWAARRQKVPCIGVGHQYAFQHQVPVAGDNVFAKKIMQHFAPATFTLGLHWDHFNCPILPPIAEVHHAPIAQESNKILVYFGFEDIEEVIDFLEPFKSHLFVIYGPFKQFQTTGNIQLKPLSRDGFIHDLASCGGVICNAGFELASEAIQLGKKLLVKPLKGQMEQLSNAKALEILNLGISMTTLDSATLAHWLDHFQGRQIRYPNVAKEIVSWLAKGNWSDTTALSQKLWSATENEALKMHHSDTLNTQKRREPQAA